MAIKTDFVAGSKDIAGNTQAINDNFEALDEVVGSSIKYYGKLHRTQSRYQPIIMNMGDSISEASSRRPYPWGSVTVASGWPHMFANTVYKKYNEAGRYSNEFAVTTTPNWTLNETVGYNLRTMVSGSTLTILPFYLNSSEFVHGDTDATLYYVKTLDGGDFDILRGSTVIASLTSSGGTGEIHKHTFTMTGNSHYYIKPKSTTNPTYVSAWSAVGQSRGRHSVVNISKGGRQLSQFSNASITEHLALYNQDLAIMSLGANDYGNNSSLTTYYDRLTHWASEVKRIGCDGLINIMIGNTDTRVGGTKDVLFAEMKAFIHNIGKANGICVVDFDEMFGGNLKATNDGFLADNIHPNIKGLTVIADTLSKLLFGMPTDNSVYPTGDKALWGTNLLQYDFTGNAQGSVSNFKGLQFGIDGAKIVTTLASGGVTRVANVLSALWTTGGNFPNSPFVGQQVLATDEDKLYICTSISPVTWKSVELV